MNLKLKAITAIFIVFSIAAIIDKKPASSDDMNAVSDLCSNQNILSVVTS